MRRDKHLVTALFGSTDKKPVRIVSMTDLDELVLSNGNVLGHRSLVPVYRQSLKPEDTRRTARIHALITQHNAGLSVPTYQSKVARKSRQKFIARLRKAQYKASKVANKQKHFRPQMDV